MSAPARRLHPGVRLQFVGQPIGVDVGRGQVGVDVGERLQGADAGRPDPEVVGVGGVDVGLVDGDPLVHQVAERGDHPLRVLLEGLGALGVQEAAGVLEPDRVVEMVQGDQRLDPGVDQPAELAAIVVDRGHVELAAAGFHPGPLQTHPVVLDVESLE